MERVIYRDKCFCESSNAVCLIMKATLSLFGAANISTTCAADGRKVTSIDPKEYPDKTILSPGLAVFRGGLMALNP